MFVRRDRTGPHRYTTWQVGLFFLAAGAWLGGVIADNSFATGASILIAAVAMLLGPLGRRERE
jgi:predicted MFS family arabinose efflux permease